MTWRPTTLTREQLEERRLEGARLLIEGQLTQAQIALHLGVSAPTVVRWKQRLEAADHAIEALKQWKARGNAPSLRSEQWQHILQIIRNGALEGGFHTERWTLARIRQMIGERFGVWISRVYISRKLHELGFSPQQPVTRASNRDDELVEAWLRQDWPRIKKASDDGADIVFIDETGFSYRELTATTWAPVGKPAVLRRVDKRRATSTVMVLTMSGRIYRQHVEHSVTAADVVGMLCYLRRVIARPMIIVWDRLAAHRSAMVKRYLLKHPDISIELLPGYAPELNPEEYYHGYVKQRMRNVVVETTQQMREHVDRELRRLRKRPQIIQGFFRRAGLDIALSG